MAGLIQRTADTIDEMSRSIWDESSRAQKVVIAVFLLITGLAIPTIPIVVLARFIAN
jgi:type I site-specific restriction endonuclease